MHKLDIPIFQVLTIMVQISNIQIWPGMVLIFQFSMFSIDISVTNKL